MKKEEVEASIIAELEFEWSEAGGFFFDYRDGKFSEEGYLRAYRAVSRIDFRGEEKISRRLVSLIYSIPFFLQCNRNLVLDHGGNKLLCNRAISEFASLVMDKIQTI